MSIETSEVIVPGPWFVERMNDGGFCNEWCVTRYNPQGSYEYESMEDSKGDLAIFPSSSEARRAIAEYRA